MCIRDSSSLQRSSGGSLQELHYLSVTTIGGNHQGSITVSIEFLEVCAGFQQGLDYLGVAIVCGQYQGSVAILVGMVFTRPGSEKGFDHLNIPMRAALIKVVSPYLSALSTFAPAFTRTWSTLRWP